MEGRYEALKNLLERLNTRIYNSPVGRMEEQNCGNSRAADFLKEASSAKKPKSNILIVFLYEFLLLFLGLSPMWRLAYMAVLGNRFGIILP